MKQFAVVGCQECHEHWIVEHLREQDIVQCPRCKHTRESHLVRVRKNTDDWHTACELRSRLLAQRAGELETFTNEVDDYGDLEDQINFSPLFSDGFQEANSHLPITSLDIINSPLFSDVLEQEANNHLEKQAERRREPLSDEVDAYFDRRWATSKTDTDNTTDRSLDSLNGDGTIIAPEQTDVRTPIRVRADCSPAALWNDIATSDVFQARLVEAVRDILADVPCHNRVQTLTEVGVTGADGGLATALAGLDRAAETDAHQRALKLVAGIGQDGATMLGHLTIEELVDGPLAVLAAAQITPTIAVHIGKPFTERRREQREDILWILAALGRVADVRVATTGLTARWLLSKHRDDLPASFSDSINGHYLHRADIDDRVNAARDELDPDARAVRVLRDLAAESGETLPYHELKSMHQVGVSRISQVLTVLKELELVEQFRHRSKTQVELLPAGSAYLDVLDAESERQDALDAEFSDSFQNSNDSRVTTRVGTPPPQDGNSNRHRCPHHHTLSWLNRPEHAATVAAAPDGGVSLVNHPVEPLDDRAAPLASFDDDHDELLVGAEYDNPMAWMVSTALALVNPRTFGRIGLKQRLESKEHTFRELLNNEREILRNARCVGWLGDDIETASEFLDELIDARKQLARMTKKLRKGDYQDRDRFRSSILRFAHGLAGTAVHIYNLIDIDVVRFLRIPRYKQFDEDDREELAKVVTKHSTITSRYGHFSVQRALYESRERKRRTAMTPQVDHADPLGTLIGGITIIGDGVDQFEEELSEALSEPDEIVEDAPEIAVRIPVKTPDRTTYGEAIQRVCKQKNLSPTREGVTLLRAFTGSPLDAATAVNWLASEDEKRELRLDEVRVALGKLDTDRLLPDTKPTVSKMLNALLRSEKRLSGQEVADEASVSRSSVWRHISTLVEIGLVDENDNGYRLLLPFATDSERGSSIVPDPLDRNRNGADDILLDVVINAIGPENGGRVSDPDDPLGQAFYDRDYDKLREEIPWLDPWIRVAHTLSSEPDPPPTRVLFGAELKQTALPDGELALEGAPG